MITKIKNAVFLTDRPVEGQSLYIQDEKILALTDEEMDFDSEIDAKGLYVSPGFIDIHVHGGGGYDFADGAVTDVKKVTFKTLKLTPTDELLNYSIPSDLEYVFHTFSRGFRPTVEYRSDRVSNIFSSFV